MNVEFLKSAVTAEVSAFISNGVFIRTRIENEDLPTIIFESGDLRLSFCLTDITDDVTAKQYRRETFYYTKEVPQFRAIVDNFTKLIGLNGGCYFEQDGVIYFILNYDGIKCTFHMNITSTEGSALELEECLDAPPPVQYRNSEFDPNTWTPNKSDKLPFGLYNRTIIGKYDSFGQYLAYKFCELVVVATLAITFIKITS